MHTLELFEFVGEGDPARDVSSQLQVAPGRVAGEHLDDRATHRPYISLAAVATYTQHLGCHEERCAFEGGHTDRLARLHLGGQTQISQLHSPALIQEKISPLDVPVHDLLLVHEGQALQDLPGVVPDLLDGEPTPGLKHTRHRP